MNARKNKKAKMPLSKRKAQTTLEWIIILAIVGIVAIVAAFAYFSGISKTQIGNGESILAAGSTGPNELTLAFSEPLPAGATVSVLTDNSAITVTPLYIKSTSATYVNNYPEYAFSVTASGPFYSSNVTGATYTLNGKTISIATATGQPLAIQPISGNYLLIPGSSH